MEIPAQTTLRLATVGYYNIHYRSTRWQESLYLGRPMDLQLATGPKVEKLPGFTAVLLPKEVVTALGLRSAVAWITHEHGSEITSSQSQSL